MALFAEGMPCPLCAQPLLFSQARFGTWGVWLLEHHPLHGYCDSVMHWECYAQWPHRPEFARTYFDFWVSEEPTNPFWHRVVHTDSLFVQVNPELASAWVTLAETGTREEVRLPKWSWWLNWRGEGSHPIEELELQKAKAYLLESMPTFRSVMKAIDMERKRSLYEQIEARLKLQEEEEMSAAAIREEFNRLCRAAMESIAIRGFTCPKCQYTGTNFRLAERQGHRSALICRACGWALRAEELTGG